MSQFDGLRKRDQTQNALCRRIQNALNLCTVNENSTVVIVFTHYVAPIGIRLQSYVATRMYNNYAVFRRGKRVQSSPGSFYSDGEVEQDSHRESVLVDRWKKTSTGRQSLEDHRKL